MLIQWKNNNRGVSIIEILIVIAIIVIALAGLLGVATFSLRISTLIRETAQANNLARETIEAVRNFRDGTNWNIDGLSTLTAGVAYCPQKSTNTPTEWELVLGEEEISGFTRKAVFYNVQRDGSDNIVESGGADDPDTKKVIVTVSWTSLGPYPEKKVEIITYLTDWRQ